MPYSALETAANNPLANLKFIAEDTVIYLSPTGSDSLGDGSLASPYRTLAHAMTKAREFTIVGNSTLTIRLLKGSYTLDTNVDLYHPQGGNLVIEGDPDAFRQRLVHSVKNYTWSIDQFSGGGQGFTVGVWDGSTTGDALQHGFSSVDNDGYFTITNARVGARSDYSGGGVAGGWNSYSSLFHGDRFFNHGCSHEYSKAIMGIGRIRRADASTSEMQVWTHTVGYDGRCPAWQEDGGLNNSLSWGNIPNNYPETQYATPNGYYGTPTWNSSTPSANGQYPAQTGTVPWITDDPLLLSTYPVVLYAPYRDTTGALYLKNGNLKAIRNLMFASSNTPYAPSVSSTAGATANISQSISVFSKQSDSAISAPNQTANRTYHESNGVGLYLENSTVSIRHLGFSGVGTAISSYGSTINKYSSDTINTSSTVSSNESNRGAVVSSLENSPILCTSHCQYGILAKNSTINLTDASGLNSEYRADRREASIHIGAKLKGIALFNSNMSATSVEVQMSSLVPNFKMRLTVPVFNGTTVDGATVSFLRYATNAAAGVSFWSAYPRAELYIQPSGVASEERIGYINYIVSDPNPLSVNSVAGVTASASSVLAAPALYSNYQVHGLLTAPRGLSFMRRQDIWNGICAGSASVGGTLTMKFFSDNSGTVLSSQLSIGKFGLRLSGANGQVFGLNGLVQGTDSRQLFGGGFVSEYHTHGSDGTYGGEYPNSLTTGVYVENSSVLTIEKVLSVNNGGCPAVLVNNNSVLNIGQGQVSSTEVRTAYAFGGGPVNFSGALCITGYAAHALEINGSAARIGALFVKHPGALNPDSIYAFETDGAAVPPLGRALYATHNSQVFLTEMYVLGLPGHRNVYGIFGTVGTGLFSSRTAKYGYNAPRLQGTNIVQYTRIENSIVYADNASSVLLGVNGLANSNFYTFAFDGGIADFTSGAITNTAAYRNCSIFAADSQSHILVSNVGQRGNGNPLGSAATNILLSGREIADSRVGNNQTIATRSRNNLAHRTIYNTTGVTRAWLGPENYTTTVTPNVGTSSGVTNVVYHPLVILTPSVSITGNNYGSHVTTQAGRYDYLSVVSFAAGDKIHSATNEYGQVDVQYISR